MATNKGDFVLPVVGQHAQPQRKARPARLTEAAILQKLTPDDWRAFRHLKAGATVARQRQQQRKAAEAAKLYAELCELEKGISK